MVVFEYVQLDNTVFKSYPFENQTVFFFTAFCSKDNYMWYCLQLCRGSELELDCRLSDTQNPPLTDIMRLNILPTKGTPNEFSIRILNS